MTLMSFRKNIFIKIQITVGNFFLILFIIKTTMESKKKLKVLSLFDGISTAYLSIKLAGIEIEKYYSSEIDKYCIMVQDFHFAQDNNFIKVGDVKNINGQDYKDVDLVIFGSPCTQLSAANTKDRSGLLGKDSSLFYEAIRILKEIKNAKNGKDFFFFMENVASMPNSEKLKITNELKGVFDKVQMIKVNSASITAANRRRLYWSNIPNMKAPEPNNIKFCDILENGFVDKAKSNPVLSTNVTLTNGIFRYYKMNMGQIIFKTKEFAELPASEKLKQYPQLLLESGYDGKSCVIKDKLSFPNGVYRLPTILEYSKLQTLPGTFLTSVPNISDTQKLKMIGNGFTTDVIAHLLTPLKQYYHEQ